MTPIIGDIIQTVGNLAGELITTEKETRQLDIAQYEAETKRVEAQTEINKVEAASSSVFVAGARPFVMWVCAFALAYAALLEPMLRFVAKVWFGYEGAFPIIDTDITLQVLFGILGLGAYRSVEKIKGVAR